MAAKKRKPGDEVIVAAIFPGGTTGGWPGTGGESFPLDGPPASEFRLVAHPTDSSKVRAIPASFVAMGSTVDGEIEFTIQIQIDTEDPDAPEWRTPVLDIRLKDLQGSPSEALRRLDVHEVVRLAVETASRDYDAPPDGLSVGPLRGRRRSRSMASQLDVTADAYRAGGVQAVADALVVGERQARNYVRRAREAGLLDPEELH